MVLWVASIETKFGPEILSEYIAQEPMDIIQNPACPSGLPHHNPAGCWRPMLEAILHCPNRIKSLGSLLSNGDAQCHIW